MEDVLLSYTEHEILDKFKNKLESRYKVKMLMPDVINYNSGEIEEVIFVKIIGESQNIGFVKRFLKRKLEAIKGREAKENDQSVIIIKSDSENESDEDSKYSSKNNNNKPKKKKQCLAPPVIDLAVVVQNSGNKSPPCTVSSTTNEDDSVIVIDSDAGEDFIPLNSNSNVTASSKPLECETTIIVSSDEEDISDHTKDLQLIQTPVSKNVKSLRPIVIDGSNVARAHGKPQNTFSCKGIKICIDYFLKRGHTQVTAFVPLFRRHRINGPVSTTDHHILEELEKTQQVVFTPSRRVDGKCYSCYDDRFIVELASTNGGVILSNDNYKDLLHVSPAFKETIEKRLLMFCFVGDMLMVPNDPLGIRGPTLDDYLSFPPENEISL